MQSMKPMPHVWSCGTSKPGKQETQLGNYGTVTKYIENIRKRSLKKLRFFEENEVTNNEKDILDLYREWNL